MLDFITLVVGLIVLVIGGDFLIKGAVSLALRMKVSMVVIGLTVVSFATSAPELIVSVYAALSGHPDMVLGNVIGSNIANLSLVLGLTAILFPLNFQRRLYAFDIPVLIAVSGLFVLFLYTDHTLQNWEGVAFVFFLFVLTSYLISRSRNEQKLKEVKTQADTGLLKLIVFLVIGAFCLFLGSKLLVESASNMALVLGISERVISMSIVAFGTSVPELAASLIAAFKKEKELSLGNLIGSNIFNLLAVLGVTSIIKPISVSNFALIRDDLYWMIGVSLLLIPLMFLFRKNQIGRIEGVVLFVCYLLCMASLF